MEIASWQRRLGDLGDDDVISPIGAETTCQTPKRRPRAIHGDGCKPSTTEILQAGFQVRRRWKQHEDDRFGPGFAVRDANDSI